MREQQPATDAGVAGPAPAAGLAALRSAWLGAALTGLLALGLRLLHLDEAPHFDELYHLLAARTWLAEGELGIAEGTYDRTALFTIAVALWMGLFGEGLEVARLTSVLAGTALVVAVYLWVDKVAGTLAAWLAALLLALWPDGITISQFLRFYALQGLLFWLGAILVYRLATTSPLSPWTAAGAAGALAAALYLQSATLLGIGGLALWAGPLLAARMRRRVALGLALGGAALGALVLLQSGLGAQLLQRFGAVPLWHQDLQGAFWFYHLQFLLDYPVLWPLTPLAVLIGFARRPRPTGFCVCVFALAFLLHSLAGPKNIRYVYYVVPFVFVLWAIAFAAIGPALWRFLEACTVRGLAAAGLRARSGAAAGVLLFLLVAVIAMNGVTIKIAAHLAGVRLPTNPGPADWAAARAPLTPWLRDADVVLTTSELEALHFLGRYDILVSRSRLDELAGTNPDFTRDPRTGRPVIGSSAALALVIGCHPDGLIVSSESRWRDPAQLDQAAADLVVERARPIELDARGMRAYAWKHLDGAPLPVAACAELSALTSGPGA